MKSLLLYSPSIHPFAGTPFPEPSNKGCNSVGVLNGTNEPSCPTVVVALKEELGVRPGPGLTVPEFKTWVSVHVVTLK